MSSDQITHMAEHAAAFLEKVVVLHNEHGEVLFLAGQFPSFVEALPEGGSQVVILSHAYSERIDVSETPREVMAAFHAGALQRLPPAPPVLIAPGGEEEDEYLAPHDPED